MLKCGLLGEHLKHSFSPEIHKRLAAYDYSLFEVEKENLSAFLSARRFDGLNVTIPYKKAVLPYLDNLSDVAKRLGSVNTVVKAADGSLYGDNTDYYGFLELLKYNDIQVSGKKVLILGSGGASVSVLAAIEDMGGRCVVISRSGDNNYGNIEKHSDADVIVNTTPVGMYPENGKTPLDLKIFKRLESVVDIIYNPLKTKLLLEAESLGLKTANGLYMLVAQAARSSELFTNSKIDDKKLHAVYKDILKQKRNIVLVGMPGCGKTSLANILGQRLNMAVIDTDSIIEEKIKTTIPEYFKTHTEEQFRSIESEAIAEAGKMSGVIISTGGGCVTTLKNYEPLHQNGTIVWIKRGLNNLPKDNRPLSQKTDMAEMFRKREPLYKSFADISVENNADIQTAAEKILEGIS